MSELEHFDNNQYPSDLNDELNQIEEMGYSDECFSQVQIIEK